jgi:hypothetical protein
VSRRNPAASAGYGEDVDEADAVLTRLQRIEILDRERAHPELLLAELRELVREAEAWVRAEPTGTERAEAAIDRCREALSDELATVPSQHR